MEINKEELEEILNALQYCYFGENCDIDFYYDVVEPFTDHYHKPFSYDKGATKGVLIFEQLNFVIKIPFTSSGDEEEYYNEDGERNYDSYEYFCGADADEEWNYCEAEAIKFTRAKEEGLGICFAETRKITEIDCYPIYIQEFAKIFSYGESKHTKEDETKVNSICNSKDFSVFNLEWLSDALVFFGEEIFYKLVDFIKRLGINDLHNANLGYINDRPVLVDYSSFNH